MADGPKSASKHGVGRQAEIHDVKYIEEFRAKLKHSQFAIASSSKGSVFDHGHVEIVEAWPAKSVAAERTKNSLIRACSAGDVYRNKEERTIVCTATEIIFPNSAARGKVRHRN